MHQVQGPTHIIGWRIRQHMVVLLLFLAMQLKGVRTTLSEVTGEPAKTRQRGRNIFTTIHDDFAVRFLNGQSFGSGWFSRKSSFAYLFCGVCRVGKFNDSVHGWRRVVVHGTNYGEGTE